MRGAIVGRVTDGSARPMQSSGPPSWRARVIGPALARVKPLASGSPEDLVAALGPTIERHLIGELGKKRHSPTRRTSPWAILRERIRRRAMTGARSPQVMCGESCGARDVLRMKRRT